MVTNKKNKLHAFTLAEVFHPVEMSKKIAFTLAEVLITLGIIGFVAALTMPTLIQNYKKNVLSTRIRKFASTFQQAVRMAEAEHGDSSQWHNDNINSDSTGEEYLEYYNKYISKYLKTVSHKILPDGVAFLLSDGSGFIYYYDLKYCVDFKKCLAIIEKAETDEGFAAKNGEYVDGKNVFLFNRNGTPYNWKWSGNIDDLITSWNTYGCADRTHLYCTKLLEVNGWKVPANYPIKL